MPLKTGKIDHTHFKGEGMSTRWLQLQKSNELKDQKGTHISGNLAKWYQLLSLDLV